MMPSLRSAVSHGLTGLLTVALLLSACQTDTPQKQQPEPELPDNELVIEDPWVRPASAGDSTMLYMTIANGQSSADTLVGAQQAPIYDSVKLYAPASDTGDMMQHEQVESLPVPARARRTLAPDSAYVVLTNLGQSLQEGGNFLVTMDFAQSGLQQIQARVRTSPPSEMQQ